VHERNNRWALYSALIRGIDKVRLIAVWDGKNELAADLDARLVKHMIDLMRDTGGIIEQINPFKLAPVDIKVSPVMTLGVGSELAEVVSTVPSVPPDNKSRTKSKPKKK
jgi:hypothetical protein